MVRLITYQLTVLITIKMPFLITNNLFLNQLINTINFNSLTSYFNIFHVEIEMLTTCKQQLKSGYIFSF